MFSIEWTQQFRRDRLENATNSNNVLPCTIGRSAPNQCRRLIKNSSRFSNLSIHLFCDFNIFNHLNKSTPLVPKSA